MPFTRSVTDPEIAFTLEWNGMEIPVYYVYYENEEDEPMETIVTFSDDRFGYGQDHNIEIDVLQALDREDGLWEDTVKKKLIELLNEDRLSILQWAPIHRRMMDEASLITRNAVAELISLGLTYDQVNSFFEEAVEYSKEFFSHGS
jgi:hypothetical protein